MRLAVNLDNLKLVTWEGYPLGQGVFMARRDRVPVELRFLRQSLVEPLPEDAVGRAGLKLPDPGSAYLAYTEGWERQGTGRETTYLFALDLHTAGIESLFSTDPAPRKVAAILEIEWNYLLAGAMTRVTSAPAKIRLANDYIQGSGDPLPDSHGAPLRVFRDADGHYSVNDAGIVRRITAEAIVSPTPPETPREGSRWINSFDASAYEYIGGAWVETTAS